MTQTSLATVILAAGKGKRMGNPDVPKVMVLLAGKPLIAHVIEQAEQIGTERTILIVGHRREIVEDYVQQHYTGVEYAVQAEQLGTGHAVQQTETHLSEFNGSVLILSGDAPLVKASTLRDFIDKHSAAGATLSVLSAHAPDPTGYGRIVRDADGNFVCIVEQKDASLEQQRITEINSGVYVVDAAAMFSALREVKSNNAQQEYYLTDIVGILREKGQKIHAFTTADFGELQGINRPEELAQAEAVYAQRMQL